MSVLIQVLIPCIVLGAFLAYLATWLTTTRGNTISDILKAQPLKDAEAIRLEILDKVKISSTVPLVALYIVAFFATSALPGLVFWQMSRDMDVITLSGSVKTDSNGTICVTSTDMEVESSGSFRVPIRYSVQPLTVNFQSDDYAPVSMTIDVEKWKPALRVHDGPDTGGPSVELSFDWSNPNVSFQRPIVLTRKVKNELPPNKATPPPEGDPNGVVGGSGTGTIP